MPETRPEFEASALIVCENPLSWDDLVHALKELRWNTVGVRNEEELQPLARFIPRPDIVLLFTPEDPKEDLEFRSFILQTALTRAFPVIVITPQEDAGCTPLRFMARQLDTVHLFFSEDVKEDTDTFLANIQGLVRIRNFVSKNH